MARDIDRSIERAIENGQKNARTIELVRNWCAHVSVEKWGGVGFVEQQTHLPVGHHYLSCPHASGNRLAAWDLADSAVDFYDRNCHDCKLRKPVGLPNIGSLVAERDTKRTNLAKANDEATRKLAAELEARDQRRAAIREGLRDPGQLSTLSLIQDIDHARDEDAGERLVAAARLAPEAFPDAIIEHLFELIDARIYRAVMPALGALAVLEVDKSRLCNTALLAITRHHVGKDATEIVVRLAHHADQNIAFNALPALIDIAEPTREPFYEPKVPDAAPLHAIHAAFPAQTRKAIERLLSQKSTHSVSVAGRAVEVLGKCDPQLMLRFARDFASKLVRKHLLLDVHDEHHENLHRIRTPVIEALKHQPREIDAILQSLLLGAAEDGAKEVYQIYGALLRENRFDDRIAVVTDAHRTAFDRLLWDAAKDPAGVPGLEAMQVFDHLPDFLAPLASERVDQLLGAAALVSDVLESHAKKGAQPEFDQLSALEWMNKQNQIRRLLDGLVEWAFRGSLDVSDGPGKVLAFYDGLPQSSELIRAQLVKHFADLMQNAQGMAEFMPTLYTALLGAETRLRASASQAVARLSNDAQQHLPDLVYEAIVIQLSDPFVAVHQAALHAVDEMNFPEIYTAQITRAVENLILAYSQGREGDAFLLECIRLYIRRYASQDQLNAKLGEFLVGIVIKLPAYDVTRQVRFLARRLSDAPNFGALLCHLLSDPDTIEYRDDELSAVLTHLTATVVAKNAEELSAVAMALPPHRKHLFGSILEAFTRAELWSDAATLADKHEASIDTSKRVRFNKLVAQLHAAACAFERDLSNKSQTMENTAAWRKLSNELKAEDAIEKQRNSRVGVFGPD